MLLWLQTGILQTGSNWVVYEAKSGEMPLESDAKPQTVGVGAADQHL